MRRLAVALVSSALLLAACGDSEPVRGTILDKDFTPGGCDVVTTVGTNGRVNVGTACSSDTWTLVVQADSGEIVTVSVDEVTYARADEGERYEEPVE